MRIGRQAIWTVALIFALGARPCMAAPINDVVADFDTGIQQSTTAVRKFYADLNDFERKLYFDKLLFDGKKEMGARQNEQSTGLLQRFSDEDIQARVLTLSVVSSYSRGLVQLASPERAKKAEKSISSIGSTIGRINKDLLALPASSNSAMVAKYAGPIGALAGMATKYWMGFQRDKALKATIEEGGPQVESLFELLESDLSDVMEGAYKNGAQTNLSNYITYYNNHCVVSDSAPAIDATRVVFLQAAHESAARYAHIAAADPRAMIKKMRKVNKDLIAWTQQKNPKPQSLDLILSDLEAYLAEVDRVTDALSAMRSAGR